MVKITIRIADDRKSDKSKNSDNENDKYYNSKSGSNSKQIENDNLDMVYVAPVVSEDSEYTMLSSLSQC